MPQREWKPGVDWAALFAGAVQAVTLGAGVMSMVLGWQELRKPNRRRH